MNKILLLVFVVFVGIVACGNQNGTTADQATEAKTVDTKTASANTQTTTINTSQNDQLAVDEEIIKKYLKDNNLEAERDPSGVYYIIEDAGGEAKPALTDQLQAHYHGTLLDGTVFDSSVERGQPLDFTLQGVIKGWQIGIPKFGKGGKGSLIIPSSLAYGGMARGKIPANAVLRFDIEVVDFKNQGAEDDKIIQKYIADKGLKAVKDPSGVYVVTEKEGSAEKPAVSNTVTVHYHGMLTNGTVFDSSVDRGEPATFPLGRVVQGWQVGIPYFGKGGKGTLIIPSSLAYGPRAAGSIPPNSVLIFDVEVIDFE